MTKADKLWFRLLQDLTGLSSSERASLFTEFQRELHQRPSLSEAQSRPFLAALALRNGSRKLAEQNPGQNAKQAYQAAAQQPGLKPLLKVMESSAALLRHEKKRRADERPKDPRKELEQARNSLRAMKTIYDELGEFLRAQVRKRTEILKNFNQEIQQGFSAGLRQTEQVRSTAHSDFMRTTFGAQDKKGNWVF